MYIELSLTYSTRSLMGFHCVGNFWLMTELLPYDGLDILVLFPRAKSMFSYPSPSNFTYSQQG